MSEKLYRYMHSCKTNMSHLHKTMHSTDGGPHHDGHAVQKHQEAQRGENPGFNRFDLNEFQLVNRATLGMSGDHFIGKQTGVKK